MSDEYGQKQSFRIGPVVAAPSPLLGDSEAMLEVFRLMSGLSYRRQRSLDR